MDWAHYRALCDRPDVVSRWLLETTLAALADSDIKLDSRAQTGSPQVASGQLARAGSTLRTALAGAPLPRPPDHRGPTALDMFRLELPAEAARALLDQLESLAATGQLAGALAGRSATAFLAAWREYAAGVVPVGHR